jgi:transcriptional regulator with XRE-family HTH domain
MTASKTTKRKSGSTQDALRLLKEQDPERHAEIASYAPVVWLARTIATLRKEAELSQTKFADMLETTQPTVSRLESGEVDPSFSRACEALAALGCRFIVAPITDEELIVTTSEEIERHLAETMQAMLPDLKQRAIADALVQIADAGLNSANADLAGRAVPAPVRVRAAGT